MAAVIAMWRHDAPALYDASVTLSVLFILFQHTLQEKWVELQTLELQEQRLMRGEGTCPASRTTQLPFSHAGLACSEAHFLLEVWKRWFPLEASNIRFPSIWQRYNTYPC